MKKLILSAFLAVFAFADGNLTEANSSIPAAEIQKLDLPKCKSLDKFVIVHGSANLSVPPDVARVNFGIKSEAMTSSDAKKTNNSLAKKVDEFFNENGISSKDYKILSFGIDMKKEGGLLSKTTYIGYRYYDVTLKNLENYADFVSNLVTIGGISEISINFINSQIEDERNSVRIQAIINAANKAKVMANSLNAELCEAIEIDEIEDSNNAQILEASDVKSANINTGLITINSRVKVKFGIN